MIDNPKDIEGGPSRTDVVVTVILVGYTPMNRSGGKLYRTGDPALGSEPMLEIMHLATNPASLLVGEPVGSSPCRDLYLKQHICRKPEEPPREIGLNPVRFVVKGLPIAGTE